MINDGGDKCTDCNQSEPPYHVGQLVTVKAWWQNGKHVGCEVEKLSENQKFIDVRPLTGNRHGRFVDVADVVPEKNNYRDDFRK